MAYDSCVGVDGLGVVGSGDRLMILEVTVSGLRKEVAQPVLKMVVRWRLPWLEEKLQKRAIHLSRPSVACVIFLCCRRNLG